MTHSHKQRITSLIDILLQKGVSRTQLMRDLRACIIKTYIECTGDTSTKIGVLYDDTQSVVRVFVSGKDTTPPDFMLHLQPVLVTYLQTILRDHNRQSSSIPLNQSRQTDLDISLIFLWVIMTLFVFYHTVYIGYLLFFFIQKTSFLSISAVQEIHWMQAMGLFALTIPLWVLLLVVWRGEWHVTRLVQYVWYVEVPLLTLAVLWLRYAPFLFNTVY